jgi:hypothetical protein
LEGQNDGQIGRMCLHEGYQPAESMSKGCRWYGQLFRDETIGTGNFSQISGWIRQRIFCGQEIDALLLFQVEVAEVRPLVQAPECGLWFRLSRCFLTFSLPMRPQVQVASPRRKEERPASHQAGWQQGAWRLRKFLQQLAGLTHQPS